MAWRHRKSVNRGIAPCMLTGLIAWLICVRPIPSSHPLPAAGNGHRLPQSAFRMALTETREWRQRAAAEVNRQREELEQWDPAAGDAGDRSSAAHEPWRLQQLAADPNGYLLRARAAALHAIDRAQTTQERLQATLLLVSIEHELGRHERELERAHALVTLQPESDLSLLALRRAANCCGGQSLGESVGGRLAVLRQRKDRVSR